MTYDESYEHEMDIDHLKSKIFRLEILIEEAFRTGYRIGHDAGTEFESNPNYISEDEAWNFSNIKRKL